MIRLTKMNSDGNYEFDFGILSSNGWSKQDLINYIANLENLRDRDFLEMQNKIIFAKMQIKREKLFREACKCCSSGQSYFNT